jgi:mannose-1-phosphate guanylyltransferase
MVPRIRKGLVLGAGLGTRLHPLTTVLPKPLLPIFGKPLIAFALAHLRESGIEEVAINTHHLAGKFAPQFAENLSEGLSVRIVHEERLLETGGAMKNLESWFGGDPFVVYSGDLISNIDLAALIGRHFETGHDVTLALRDTGIAAGIAFDPATQLVTDIAGMLGRPAPETLDFANISVWNPNLLGNVPHGQKIPLYRVLLSCLARGGKVAGIVLDQNHWFNISSRADYFSVHHRIRDLDWRPSYLSHDWRKPIDPSARVEPGLVMEGVSWVGPRSVIGRDVRLHDTFLWADSVVRPGLALSGSVVANVVVSGPLVPDQDFGFVDDVI